MFLPNVADLFDALLNLINLGESLAHSSDLFFLFFLHLPIFKSLAKHLSYRVLVRILREHGLGDLVPTSTLIKALVSFRVVIKSHTRAIEVR